MQQLGELMRVAGVDALVREKRRKQRTRSKVRDIMHQGARGERLALEEQQASEHRTRRAALARESETHAEQVGGRMFDLGRMIVGEDGLPVWGTRRFPEKRQRSRPERTYSLRVRTARTGDISVAESAHCAQAALRADGPSLEEATRGAIETARTRSTSFSITVRSARDVGTGAIDATGGGSVMSKDEKTALAQLKSAARAEAERHGHVLGPFVTMGEDAGVKARCRKDKCIALAIVSPERAGKDGDKGFGGSAVKAHCKGGEALDVAGSECVLDPSKEKLTKGRKRVKAAATSTERAEHKRAKDATKEAVQKEKTTRKARKSKGEEKPIDMGIGKPDGPAQSLADIKRARHEERASKGRDKSKREPKPIERIGAQNIRDLVSDSGIDASRVPAVDEDRAVEALKGFSLEAAEMIVGAALMGDGIDFDILAQRVEALKSGSPSLASKSSATECAFGECAREPKGNGYCRYHGRQLRKGLTLTPAPEKRERSERVARIPRIGLDTVVSQLRRIDQKLDALLAHAGITLEGADE
jgi:hypothetical protein